MWRCVLSLAGVAEMFRTSEAHRAAVGAANKSLVAAPEIRIAPCRKVGSWWKVLAIWASCMYSPNTVLCRVSMKAWNECPKYVYRIISSDRAQAVHTCSSPSGVWLSICGILWLVLNSPHRRANYDSSLSSIRAFLMSSSTYSDNSSVKCVDCSKIFWILVAINTQKPYVKRSHGSPPINMQMSGR